MLAADPHRSSVGVKDSGVPDVTLLERNGGRGGGRHGQSDEGEGKELGEGDHGCGLCEFVRAKGRGRKR